MSEQASKQTSDAGAEHDGDDNSREMRAKLLGRLAMAGVLVAGLLGILAFFDHLSSAPDDSEVEVFTKPVPVAPRKEISQPVTQAENLPPAPTVAPVTAPAESAPQTQEVPPPPSVAAEPAKPPVGEDAKAPVAAPRVPTAVKPLDRTGTSDKPVVADRVPAPIPEATSAPQSRAAHPVEAPTLAPVVPPAPKADVMSGPSRPSARVVESHPAPQAALQPAPLPATAIPRLFSGFVLQAGVFSSIQRAEELHARLTLSGVPSSVETRVQVGPFRTRQEAEAAQAKLRELGVDAILVPPRGKQ